MNRDSGYPTQANTRPFGRLRAGLEWATGRFQFRESSKDRLR